MIIKYNGKLYLFTDQLKTTPILVSRNCTVNDTMYFPYYYKGKYSNGGFDGPGKFVMKFEGSHKYPKALCLSLILQLKLQTLYSKYY